MTFSIVAVDPDGSGGVAVASRFLAVGALVPAARAGVGALATQSLPNLRYRPLGLELLAAGTPAAEAVRQLTATDEERDVRQLGVVGRDGDAATFTGGGCHPWAGGRTGPGYAVQGNILTGPEVLDAMAEAFLAAGQEDLPARLLAALEAGQRAGGDRRGRQSAALRVVRPGAGYVAGPCGPDDPLLDLRVDDDPEPLVRLRDLLHSCRDVVGRPGPDDDQPELATAR